MQRVRLTTKDIVYIALFAALMAALALFPPITLPMLGGVPITAQSMGPMLAGAILGARRGAFSMLLFLALVAIGLPILSGGRGGLGVFMGPTAGFLFGYAAAAFAVGYLHERFWRGLNVVQSLLFTVAGGIVALYAIGIPWAALNTGMSLTQMAAGSAVFIPGDLVKAGLTAIIAVTVKRAYPLIHTAN